MWSGNRWNSEKVCSQSGYISLCCTRITTHVTNKDSWMNKWGCSRNISWSQGQQSDANSQQRTLTAVWSQSYVTLLADINHVFCFQDRVSELPAGPQPPFFTENLFNFVPLALFDRKPENMSFGDVLEQVYPVYRLVGNTFTLLPCSSGSTLMTPLCAYVDKMNLKYSMWVSGWCCDCHVCSRKPEKLWRYCKNSSSSCTCILVFQPLLA